MIKQFYFLQFSLAEVISLHSLWIYQTFIWPIGSALVGALTPARVDLAAVAMKEYSTFPNAARLEPHHQMA